MQSSKVANDLHQQRNSYNEWIHALHDDNVYFVILPFCLKNYCPAIPIVDVSTSPQMLHIEKWWLCYPFCYNAKT